MPVFQTGLCSTLNHVHLRVAHDVLLNVVKGLCQAYMPKPASSDRGYADIALRPHTIVLVQPVSPFGLENYAGSYTDGVGYAGKH